MFHLRVWTNRDKYFSGAPPLSLLWNILFYLSLDILPLQTRRQALGQLFGLLLIIDDQGVQKTRAADLELGAGGTLANLHKTGVLTTGLLEEVADVGNLLRHDEDVF